MILGGGSGVNYQTQIVTKLPNENIQTYQPQMIDSWVWGGGVNYQMQIVTKLPNENGQNYQLQMIDSGGDGKLPTANCDQTTKWYHRSGSEMTQNGQFHPIHNFSNLFPPKWHRITPTEVAQNDSEQPILPDLQLFKSFPTKVAQNDSE